MGFAFAMAAFAQPPLHRRYEIPIGSESVPNTDGYVVALQIGPNDDHLHYLWYRTSRLRISGTTYAPM